MRAFAKCGERLAAHALHDNREEEVPGIRVAPLGPRREVERLLVRDRPEAVVVVREVGVVEAVDREEPRVVPQAARVVEQVTQRDGPAVDGHLGDVLADVVVERELAVLHEEQDGERRELLGDGADVEDRVRADGDVVLEAREAVAAGEGELAGAVDGDRAAGGGGLGVVGEEGVDFRREGVGGRGGDGGRGRGRDWGRGGRGRGGRGGRGAGGEREEEGGEGDERGAEREHGAGW